MNARPRGERAFAAWSFPEIPALTMNQIAPTALYQEVAERLRQRIYSHELPPGSWVDEQAIAEQYGISRTPLREALKVLAAEGLVTLKPRRGCYVTEISEQDLDDIFPLMAILEGRCAAECVRKMAATDLAQLDLIHAELEAHAKNQRIEGFFDANQRFHAEIQRIAGNRWLTLVIQDLRKVLKLTRLHSLTVEGRLDQSLKEHRRIMQAIKAHDDAAAERAMHDHLLAGRKALAKLGASARQVA
jgi:DNA-binding GntR family transcriptional regulator